MRVLHTGIFTNLPAGVKNQLDAEQQAIKKLNIPWDIAFFSENKPQASFMKLFPRHIKTLAARRIFFLCWLIKAQHSYDVVLFRHPIGDPFAWFMARYLKRFVTIHHTKEVPEIPNLLNGWKQKLATFIEFYAGSALIRRASGLIALTDEILIYELARKNSNSIIHNNNNNNKLKHPCFIFPNGIDLRNEDVVKDTRSEIPQFLFVASVFQNWQGLDRLFTAMEQDNSPCILHIAGNVKEQDKTRAALNNLLSKRITFHGMLNKSQLRDVASMCHLGIGPLGLDRKSMTSACTLKVREYLAWGLPVFAGSQDSGLPDDFAYYNCSKPNLGSMICLAKKMSAISREQVRRESISFINKQDLVKGCYDWLCKAFIK